MWPAKVRSIRDRTIQPARGYSPVGNARANWPASVRAGRQSSRRDRSNHRGSGPAPVGRVSLAMAAWPHWSGPGAKATNQSTLGEHWASSVRHREFEMSFVALYTQSIANKQLFFGGGHFQKADAASLGSSPVTGAYAFLSSRGATA